jgi:hypothetical protein
VSSTAKVEAKLTLDLPVNLLVGNPEGKRPLGRPRRRWVNNIKRYLREIGFDGMDWIDVAPDRDQWRALVNTAMNFSVP